MVRKQGSLMGGSPESCLSGHPVRTVGPKQKELEVSSGCPGLREESAPSCNRGTSCQSARLQRLRGEVPTRPEGSPHERVCSKLIRPKATQPERATLCHFTSLLQPSHRQRAIPQQAGRGEGNRGTFFFLMKASCLRKT